MDAYSLGQLLRQAREERELALEDARNKTRIAVPILESFESGTFEIADLSQVQVRGMLANYASFLGLEAETILTHYANSIAMASRRKRGRGPSSEPSSSRRQSSDPRRAVAETRSNADIRRPQTEPRRAGTGDPTNSQRSETFGSRREKRTRRGRGFLNLLVIITLTLASLVVIAVIAAELLQRSPDATIDPGISPQPNSLISDLPATFTFTPPPTPTTIRTPTLIPRSPQNYQGEPVLVTVDITQRAWVRMIVDGAELFSGLVRPDELTLEYRAVNEIILSSSNAEALAVTYNGQLQPRYGGRGQAVEIVYRPGNSVTIETGGAFAPTSAFSPTPSETSEQLIATLLAEGTPTATEGPSPTPTETFTASPSPEFSLTPSTPPTATEPPTLTATLTASHTATETPPPSETPPPTATPSATAIVPPRVTPVDATPPKTP